MTFLADCIDNVLCYGIMIAYQADKINIKNINFLFAPQTRKNIIVQKGEIRNETWSNVAGFGVDEYGGVA